MFSVWIIIITAFGEKSLGHRAGTSQSQKNGDFTPLIWTNKHLQNLNIKPLLIFTDGITR